MLSKEKLKRLSRLKTKKGRNKQGKFLIEGLRLCEEAAESLWPIESVLFTSSFAQKTNGKELLKKMQKLNADLIPVKSQVLAKLSDTVTAQGIMCVAKTKRLAVGDLWEKEIKLIVALDGIRDPGNVGTLIRTADAFRVGAVLLSDDTVELYNPKVVRSAMGSIFHLPILDEVDLVKIILQLKKRKFRIFATHTKEGVSLDKLDPSGRICLLIGNEAEGLNRKLLEVSDEIIHIPTYGKAESLNVAVAGGILLYEITRKRMRSPAT
ncbi:MAG: RNA methyltransferase [candidate division Zixibacteria bacterium]|nr:RNA methyltransferase [candidate division Zixibacteria bacterium]